MFDRAQRRMERYTKDHNEDYRKYKGQQTKGESGGHGQVFELGINSNKNFEGTRFARIRLRTIETLTGSATKTKQRFFH